MKEMKKFLLLPVFCFVLIFALNIHTADNAVNTINSNTVETKERIFTYIANQKTKKFHLPSYESVYQMNDENMLYLNDTRDDAIAKGYSPCKRCNP